MKKLFSIITMMFILYNPNIISQFNGFEWINPKPQGNKLNSIGFFNTNDGIAVGNFGTLLKTSNGGSSWEHIMIEAPNNLNALDIVDANTAFIAGDMGLILKTTNSGSTWLILNSNLDTNLTAIKFLDQNIGYAAGMFGTIIQTTNGGNNWSKKVIYYNNTDIEVIDSNNAFIVGDAGSILRTTDGGNIWSNIILLPSVPLTGITFTNSTTGYIVGGYIDNGVIYKSTDSGNNWTNIFSGSSLGILNVFFKDENSGFAIGYSGTIRKTIDAGNTWTEIVVETKMDLLDGFFINSNTGFIVGVGGKILRTADGGDTWNEISQGNENFLFAIDIVNENLAIAVGQYGTILKSTDGGNTWLDRSLNLVFEPYIYDVKMLSATYGLAVDWNGMTHITTDAGDTWTLNWGINANPLTKLEFTDNNTGYATGMFGKLLKTTDSGTTWNELSTGNTESYLGIDFVNNTTGFVCGTNGLILKTTNSGTNWSTCNFDPNYYFTDISFSDSVNGIVVGQYSIIFKTSDGGVNWDSVYGVQYSTMLNSIKRVTPQLIYVCGESGKVLYSTDGGNIWNQQISNTNNYLYDIALVDTSLFIVGESGTILKFHNSIIPVELTSFSASVMDNNVNLNWSTATELNNSGFEIQRLKDLNTVQTNNWDYIGFVNGNGTSSETHSYTFQDHSITSGKYQFRLKQIDFDGSFEYSNIVEVEIGTPDKFILEQNYPNPFNPTTKISWQSPVSGHQTLKVYDILGNEIATLIDEFRSAGSYETTFSAHQFSSGMYWYKIQIGEFISTKKMVLLK